MKLAFLACNALTWAETAERTTSRVDQSCASVDRNRHSQRFGDLFCRRSVLARHMYMCRDRMACRTNRQRNQFARLRVEPSSLGAGVTQLAMAPHRLRAEPPEIANRFSNCSRY
jgi:hypothetical protein